MGDQQLPPQAPKVPVGDGDVPDKVLEELLAAFSDTRSADAAAVDFDDPSIDRLLGLAPPKEPSDTELASDGPDAGDDVEHAQAPDTDADADGVDAAASPTGETQTTTTIAADAVDPAAKPQRSTIRIGGDDNFVDAVYLDEEGGERLRGDADRATEASVERTTILIGDDEVEGSSGGIPVATGTMDPRLRARRIAVKRAISRKRLKWIVIPVVVVVLVAGVLAVLGSSLFAVNDVDISGAREISPEDLQAAVDKLDGRPVLLIDTHEIEAQLERSPWVREARVNTDFPHRATIELVERVPLATYAGTDGRFRIIDVDGAVVDVIAGQPVAYMLVTGPGVNAEAGGSAGEAFAHAAELVDSLSPAVRSRTESVGVSDSGELSLRFHNGADVIIGAPRDLLGKLTRLEAFLKRSEADEMEMINVSTQEISFK